MSQSTKTKFDSLLRDAGLDQEIAAAIMEIDSVMQNWRRRANKRELGNKALADLDVRIDLAQLDVLFGIEGPASDAGEGETMVGTVAERLNIDPSRASRLVSEMVEQGFARRAASQADARRTIIELTERGQAVVDAVRAYKYLIMADFLGAWDRAELAVFVPLLGRFGSWMDNIGAATEKHAGEIAALAQGIAEAGEADKA
jgi:DNA-binding MarR family transcriptional regulator